MVAPKENIVMWLKLVWLFFSILTLLLASRLMPLALQLTSSTICPYRFSEVSPPLNFYMVLLIIMRTFIPFGCRVYPCLCDYMPNKFSPRSIPCIFMGYNTFYKGFCCLDPFTSRMYITQHAQFDENYFPSLDTS
jgi:hypothetical protein